MVIDTAARDVQAVVLPGSTALHLAWQAVAYGIYDCVVAIGFEKLDQRDRARIQQAINAGMDLSELSEMFGPGARREQVVELAWQLEGRCGARQVESARVALADNAGGWMGWDVGARVVHLLVR